MGDFCVRGTCRPGTLTLCNGTSRCNYGECVPSTGLCTVKPVDNAANVTCDDLNLCTINDRCTNGTCAGDVDPIQAENNVACGAVIPAPPSSTNNTSIIIFAVAGAAALIGAIAGLAFLIKRVRDNKLLDAETWNPDTFTSVGANPLYSGSEKAVNNRLYEGSM